jgi:hypothetical protein
MHIMNTPETSGWKGSDSFLRYFFERAGEMVRHNEKDEREA